MEGGGDLAGVGAGVIGVHSWGGGGLVVEEGVVGVGDGVMTASRSTQTIMVLYYPLVLS